MIFREIGLDDMPRFDRYKHICSDYAFSYLFMYNDLYKLKMAETDGTIVIRSDKSHTHFYMPLGNTVHGIQSVIEYCKENDISPVFTRITEDYLAIFNDFNFHIEEDRDSYDYIYKNSDFLEYNGKEFRTQRNNLFSYLKNFTPEFDDNIKLYTNACEAFTVKHHNLPDILEPTLKMLQNIDVFSLKGGVVLNRNEVVAFCLYEKISDNMIQSHVELTDNSHRGVHAYLINELAKRISETYINKEDDMGLAGLRKFKEKFNPHFMLKKYKAYFEGGIKT